MHKAIIIGNLGADAVEQKSQGQSFISFRVACTDRYTDQSGQKHETTDWIDCTMNGMPPVFPYLKKGVTVCVIGDERLRIYSSQKERRMKAGAQVYVRSVELIGGRADDVPSRLYDQNGVMHEVKKWYHTDSPDTVLFSMSQRQFNTDANGWVYPVTQSSGDAVSAADVIDGSGSDDECWMAANLQQMMIAERANNDNQTQP